MSKILAFTAFLALMTPVLTRAEGVGESLRTTKENIRIDPGSCEARIFLINIHPSVEPTIRRIIEEKGYIDTLKVKRTPGFYYSPFLTLSIQLNYHLGIPVSNHVVLKYVEYIPGAPDSPIIAENLYFAESNWTLGKSTIKACEDARQLVDSLPICIGYDSPLVKQD